MTEIEFGCGGWILTIDLWVMRIQNVVIKRNLAERLAAIKSGKDGNGVDIVG